MGSMDGVARVLNERGKSLEQGRIVRDRSKWRIVVNA